MTVLVTYATKHGSTREIAEAIATTLVDRGIPTEVLSVGAVAEVGRYDAVVLGSALYVGRWLKEATEFARRHRDPLNERPLWLFSSGPLGTQVVDAEEQPRELAELRETLEPRDHRLFYGALTRDALGFGERMVVKAVKAPEGDFRDWDEIRAWAATIADELARDSAAS
ncbi:MAG TPA: flavodoxin domain-containing protein [Actinomycetota bacterium]|nr:flavodoxin domain-containing protein [Actinomycetota bacterium]